jgi:outer membrane protein TolC
MLRTFSVFLLCVVLFPDSIFSQNQQLDFYISEGLKNSPLLKDYTNQAQSLIFDSLKTRAGLKPVVNAGANAMYAPSAKNFGYDSAITNGGNYSALVSISQPLFRKRIRENQFENIALQNEGLSVQMKITKSDLSKLITSQYIAAYSDYSQMEFTRSLILLLNEEQSHLKTLVEKGIYMQTDYLNLNISIQSQQISLKQFLMQYKNDLYSLNLLCGISDTGVIGLSNPELRIKHDNDISNSPMFMQFRIDSLRIMNNKSLVEINYKPKLNAFADAGFNAINPKNIPFNFGTSIGLNFTVPLYDGKQRKYDLGKLSLAENTRLNYSEFYSRQFQQRIQQLKEQLKSLDELRIEISIQLAEQQKLIDLYKAEIEKGLVRFSDFILTVNNYTGTKNTLKQTEISRMQIINEINYIK